MSDIVGAVAVIAALAVPQPDLMPHNQTPSGNGNWCTVGYTVMVPDGREGLVTSTEGEICRVLADGEAYVTPLPYFIVEPVYPQNIAARPFGH